MASVKNAYKNKGRNYSSLISPEYERDIGAIQTGECLDGMASPSIDIGQALELIKKSNQLYSPGTITDGSTVLNKLIVNPSLFMQLILFAIRIIQDSFECNCGAPDLPVTEEQVLCVWKILSNVYPLIQSTPSSSTVPMNKIEKVRDYSSFLAAVSGCMDQVSVGYYGVMKQLIAACMRGDVTTSDTQNMQRMQVNFRLGTSDVDRMLNNMNRNPSLDNNASSSRGDKLFKATAGQYSAAQVIKGMLDLFNDMCTPVEYFRQSLSSSLSMIVGSNTPPFNAPNYGYDASWKVSIPPQSVVTIPLYNNGTMSPTGMVISYVAPGTTSPVTISAPVFVLVPSAALGMSGDLSGKPQSVQVVYTGGAAWNMEFYNAPPTPATVTFYPIVGKVMNNGVTTSYTVGVGKPYTAVNQTSKTQTASYNSFNVLLPTELAGREVTGYLATVTWTGTSAAANMTITSTATCSGQFYVPPSFPLYVAIPSGEGISWVVDPPTFMVIAGVTSAGASASALPYTLSTLRFQIEDVLAMRYGPLIVPLCSVLNDLGIVSVAQSSDLYLSLSTALAASVDLDASSLDKMRSMLTISSPLLTQNSTVSAFVK